MTAPSAVIAAAAHRPLAWWSQAALAQLSGRIDRACRTWCDEWDLPAATVEAYNASQAPAEPPAPSAWQCLEAAQAAPAWLGSRGDAVGMLLHAMFDGGPSGSAPRGQAGPLARAVADQAWTALQAVVGEALRPSVHALPAPVPKGSAPDKPSDRDMRPWSGAVRVLVRLGNASGDSVWLHLSPDCAADHCSNGASLKLREPAAAELVAVSEALSRQPLRLRVELGAFELELGSLQGLQVGDVVPLPHRLDEPLFVHMAHGRGPAAPDQPPLCAAYLGARHGRCAIELVRGTESAA